MAATQHRVVLPKYHPLLLFTLLLLEFESLVLLEAPLLAPLYAPLLLLLFALVFEMVLDLVTSGLHCTLV